MAGAVRADVDEQVAAMGDDVGEQVDELGAGDGVGGGLLGVVAEGAVQAPAQLPGPRGAPGRGWRTRGSGCCSGRVGGRGQRHVRTGAPA